MRRLSAVLAVLLVVQAVLGAWHGASMAGGRPAGAAGDGSIVICTAHGQMRLTVDGDFVPVDPAGDPAGKALNCPLCLALSADVWLPPADAVPVERSRAHLVVSPREEHLVAHAPRAPPQQRGPPALV